MRNLQIALIAAAVVGCGYSGVLVAAKDNPRTSRWPISRRG